MRTILAFDQTDLSPIIIDIYLLSYKIFSCSEQCVQRQHSDAGEYFLESDSFKLFFATKDGLKNQVCTFAVPTW